MAEQESKVPKFVRVFDAPREKVWRAWTEPELMKKWWGPKEFMCPDAVMDVRPGGKYKLSMSGPGFPKIWSGGTYKEVVPMDKLVVVDHFADENGDPIAPKEYGMEGMPEEMQITITFADQPGGKTKLTIAYADVIPDKYRTDMTSGWNSSLDKLAELVEGRS